MKDNIVNIADVKPHRGAEHEAIPKRGGIDRELSDSIREGARHNSRLCCIPCRESEARERGAIEMQLSERECVLIANFRALEEKTQNVIFETAESMARRYIDGEF